MDGSERRLTASMARGLEGPDQKQRPGISFLDLPRELREMIYRCIPDNSGAFTYDTRIKRPKPHWPVQSVGSCQEHVTFDRRFGNPGVAFGTGEHCFAILSTCRALYSEALPVVYAATPLGLWRPMYDYGGLSKYPNFVAKVFDSLPEPATQYIRTIQLQGELWHNNMAQLLSRAITDLPSLKILDIGLDPYYETSQRKHWFDDRRILRQSWPTIATLYSVAQHLDTINITVSPPADRVHVISFNHPDGIWLSGTAYDEFVWLQLQLSVLMDELTIYGALISGNAKTGMEFFMDRVMERQDLFELVQGRKVVDRCIAGTARFKLEEQKNWLREITGRIFEIDEKQRKVTVVSDRDAKMRWCKMTYTSSPRGSAIPQCVHIGDEMAAALAQRLVLPHVSQST
ncbi:unnamed protein product [Aureobasidium mustum]|uniref:Uncharacterized protein n=1 Tax=Aureobasidium mustum TaxID=2773714 RepID=A0A9N8JC71_9PEZI|nr:unnamed protein product [Aureobasidium mustum]